MAWPFSLVKGLADLQHVRIKICQNCHVSLEFPFSTNLFASDLGPFIFGV